MSQYDLELETKQGYGIKINGSELNLDDLYRVTMFKKHGSMIHSVNMVI